MKRQRSLRFLLTGGRAPVTLDLARALHERGHVVLMAESQKEFLSKSSRAVSKSFLVPAPNSDTEGFISALERIIADERVDVLLPTCEEAFFVSRGVDRLGKRARVWVDRPETLKFLHSKWDFIRKVRELGLEAPATSLCRSDAEAVSECEAAGESMRVLKPVFSRFAAKTLIGKGSELKAQAAALGATGERPWVAQEFLPGEEFCTYALAHEGKLLLHVTYSHEFTAGKGAGICFESVRQPAIEAWVARFVSAIGYTGQIAFDFIVDSQGVARPLECNPRATSGLHLVAREPRLHMALADPSSVDLSHGPIRPRHGAAGLIRLAMWIYGLSSVRSLSRLSSWARIMWASREVVFDWRDPRPFFTQFACFYGLVREARRKGITPLEASTQDIEWNGA